MRRNAMNKNGYSVTENDSHKPELICKGKPKVAFICVHNSCRSQMAEALGKLYAADVFESYSAGTELKDYKFFTFGGKVEFIQVDFGRFTNHRRNFYNKTWDLLNIQQNYPTDYSTNIKKPDKLEDMISIAEKIASNLIHVRVDFYCTPERIYIGELTFYHDSGFIEFFPSEINNVLGEKIKIQ